YAEALIGLDHYEEALYFAEQALFMGEEDKTPEYVGMAWRTLGMTTEKLGRPFSLRDRATYQMIEYDASACFSKSEQIFAEAEIEMERARTLREWSTYLFKTGDQQAATKMWQEAREIFSNLGADMEVQRMNRQPE